MARTKIKITSETKNLQEHISKQIAQLVNSGLTQTDIADALSMYQPEISQLFRKSRTLSTTRFKEIKAILERLIAENINPTDVESHQDNIKPEHNYGTWLFDQLTVLNISEIEFANEASLSFQTIRLIINGTTTNPQYKTKQTIENTLERISKAKKTTIATVDKVKEIGEGYLFIGIPFTKEEIDQTPNKIGVYGIHDKRGYPTYIGKGNIKGRLKDHSERTAFASPKVAATFSYYILQNGDTQAEKIEANKNALLFEKILTKFAGNTILLNVQNIEDLSQED